MSLKAKSITYYQSRILDIVSSNENIDDAKLSSIVLQREKNPISHCNYDSALELCLKSQIISTQNGYLIAA